MTHKQRETMREIRLWIAQVIIPVGVALSIPEVRQAVEQKVSDVKTKILRKIR